MLKIDILTIFPSMFTGPFAESIIKRAQEKALIQLAVHDLRSWAGDRHKTVDGRPYGGGPGMVIRVDVVARALSEFKDYTPKGREKIVLLTPQGKVFSQDKARKFSGLDRLILIAGHYEGFDERVREHLVDEELSIGDYVLTGGELPAMVVVDAVVRLVPGVLGEADSLLEESFSPTEGKTPDDSSMLEYPQYTRPEKYKGWEVPPILLSGNHREIASWRRKKAKERTRKRRPDLLRK